MSKSALGLGLKVHSLGQKRFFKVPKVPDIPEIGDEEVQEERRKQLARRQAGGRASTILSGGAGITTPILGSAAQIGGI